MVNHQRRARYCLTLQKTDAVEDFICDSCKKNFNQKSHLVRHLIHCRTVNIAKSNNETISEFEKKIIIMESEKKVYCERFRLQDIQISQKDDVIKDLQNKLAGIAEKSVSNITNINNNNTTIEIDDNKNTSSEDISNEYVSNGEYSIEYRDEDGYINVSNLCKASSKHFKDWKKLDKTNFFLNALSLTTNIIIEDLIKYSSHIPSHEIYVWAHPQIAINISQWISPKFDVKVSGWIYEVMITGKVDIANTKTYLELQKENKDKEIKIKFLTNKYVKSQPGDQYIENYVVYLLTTILMRKERRYILGKAKNLTKRLSTYNKTDEHIVIYYHVCTDENTMSIVENMVFKKLDTHREQANRERFILPENVGESYFIDKIKECADFWELSNC
jgi:hypothetical protein